MLVWAALPRPLEFVTDVISAVLNNCALLIFTEMLAIQRPHCSHSQCGLQPEVDVEQTSSAMAASLYR